ncbi:hypothetical protein [Spiroplasma endosymbiont of Villa modesta]|uniref:hypothetical protein n=1 Tax=Spiroplasma endosymbiont of Villa modesta TaxID=3066293 RepID=UPI00313BAE58
MKKQPSDKYTNFNKQVKFYLKTNDINFPSFDSISFMEYISTNESVLYIAGLVYNTETKKFIISGQEYPNQKGKYFLVD